MRIHRCDICKANVADHKLVELLPEHRHKGVNDACNDCHSEISKALLVINSALVAIKQPLMRRFIHNLSSRIRGDKG